MPARGIAGAGETSMKIVPSLFVCALSISSAFANDFPKFQVDASWPKPLPNNWIIGQAAGVAVDAQDNVWVIQRPRTLTDDEKAASFTPPRTKCCVPAPPVMQFDSDGNLLKAWGGPGQGYDWFENEHGINIDSKGFVWVGGNGNNDGHVLKFTQDGKFVLQIGKPGPQTGSADTSRLGRPADTAIIASSCLMPTPAPTSATGAPTESRRAMRKLRPTILPGPHHSSSRTPFTA